MVANTNSTTMNTPSSGSMSMVRLATRPPLVGLARRRSRGAVAPFEPGDRHVLARALRQAPARARDGRQRQRPDQPPEGGAERHRQPRAEALEIGRIGADQREHGAEDAEVHGELSEALDPRDPLAEPDHRPG